MMSETKNATTFVEPLEDPSNNRLMYFPVLYPDIDEYYKIQVQAHWTFEAHKVEFTKDHDTISSLPDDVRSNIEHPLVFLAVGDFWIADNLSVLMERIKIPEAKRAYAFQQQTEICIHNPTYSHIVLPFLGVNKLESLLQKIKDSEPLMRKKEFMSRYFTLQVPLGIQLVAATFNEGLFFASSFAYIFWCKEKGLLMGIAKANEMIARDEWTHTKLSIALFQHVMIQPTEADVHELAKEAVKVESEFADYSIITESPGMSKALMRQYIQYLADVLLVLLGYSPIWKVENPLPFMEKMGMSRMNDFFTGHTTEYKDPSTYARSSLKFDEDF